MPDLPPDGVKARPGTSDHQFDSTDVREAHIVRGMGCPPSFALLYTGFRPILRACVPHVDFRPHRNTLELAGTNVSRQHWFRRS